jgi:hypothetical protein
VSNKSGYEVGLHVMKGIQGFGAPVGLRAPKAFEEGFKVSLEVDP